MGVEVQGADDAERALPAQAQAADDAHHRLREPRDEAEGVQVGGHGDEGREPGQRVPRAVVVQALLRGAAGRGGGAGG